MTMAYPGQVQSDPPFLDEPGGPAAALSVQVLAGAGYAVLAPSLPRPPQTEGPAAGYAGQILAIVDEALALEPQLDPSRLALWGHSFGGYGALAAATQTDRFGAVIAAASVSDLTSAWGGFWPRARVAPEDAPALRARAGWAEEGQAQMRAPPWEAPDRYRRNSPLYMADRITTPLLLIHGDMDNAPVSQAELMFSALARQNKDVQLATYWEKAT
jgi:dipeptidyl aminopeptidase/acylaminoacyl peptidase